MGVAGRLVPVLIGVVVLAGGIFGLLALFNARDDAGVSEGASAGPGQVFPDRGAEHLSGSERAPRAPADQPPTSGPHRPDNVGRDARRITEDQLLHALELGDVVLAYGTRRPPPELRALQRDVAGPFDAELAAAGQAVILARRPGLDGVVALAWRHAQRARDPGDPAVRRFAEAWLGKGARAG